MATYRRIRHRHAHGLSEMACHSQLRLPEGVQIISKQICLARKKPGVAAFQSNRTNPERLHHLSSSHPFGHGTTLGDPNKLDCKVEHLLLLRLAASFPLTHPFLVSRCTCTTGFLLCCLPLFSLPPSFLYILASF